MSYIQFISEKPIAKPLWEETSDIMATHIYGKPPRRLFETRRPLESTNEYALNYRLSNFEPITKQPFLTAINSIVETAEHIYAPEINVSEATSTWIQDNRIKVGQQSYDLRSYILKHTAIKAEADPNAAIVVLPEHPREKLNPRRDAEIPDFNNVINEPVNIDVRLVKSKNICYIDEDLIIFEAGHWMYSIEDKKEKYAQYYFAVSKDSTVLIYPVKSGDGGVAYSEVLWYANNLEHPPFTVIGNNLEIGIAHGETVTYATGTFPGAVAIMNEVLGVKSDSQIVDTRFTYPEKIVQYQACGAAGAINCVDRDSPYFGRHVIYTDDSCQLCNECNGSGRVQPDTSPFGSHIMVKSDMFDETDGKFIPPIQFITPPLQSAEYLDKKWRLDFAEGKRALFILDQNMTNQSGVSKAYDVRQKISVITGAVKNLFRVYSTVLTAINGYFLDPMTVEIDLPNDFNVKTSQDVTLELKEAGAASSVYVSELTKELLLKRFGNDATAQKIVNFLQLADKFFGYNIDQVLKAKAIYGNAITPRDQYIHDKGFNILESIALSNDNFLELSGEQLLAIFNAEVDRLFTTPPISIA